MNINQLKQLITTHDLDQPFSAIGITMDHMDDAYKRLNVCPLGAAAMAGMMLSAA